MFTHYKCIAAGLQLGLLCKLCSQSPMQPFPDMKSLSHHLFTDHKNICVRLLLREPQPAAQQTPEEVKHTELLKKALGTRKPDVRVLVIRKKWCDKIFDPSNPKTMEVRKKITSVRGRLLIFAAKQKTIVGAVTLTDCLAVKASTLGQYQDRTKASQEEMNAYLGEQNTAFLWTFADPKPLNVPHELKRGVVNFEVLHEGDEDYETLLSLLSE